MTGSPLLDHLVVAGEAEPPTADPSRLTTLPPMEPDGTDAAAELAAAREQERWYAGVAAMKE